MDNTIFIKDSTKDMSEVGTASIDLIITSPPYWNLKNYNNHPKQLGIGLTYNHYFEILKQTLKECMRVLKEDGIAVFIVGDIMESASNRGSENRPRILPLHSDIINYFITMGFEFFQHFIWKKQSVKKGEKGKIVWGSINKKWAIPPYLYADLSIEHVIVFRKPGKKRVLPSMQVREAEEYNRIPKEEFLDWANPVWNIDSPYNKEHPATFSSILVNRLIKMYSLKNDYILDPFCGTGTTITEAIELKRNAIGYEINKSYITHLIDKYNFKNENNKYTFSLKID